MTEQKRIPDLPELDSLPDDAAKFPVVDPLDTTDSPDGTTKFVTMENVMSGVTSTGGGGDTTDLESRLALVEAGLTAARNELAAIEAAEQPRIRCYKATAQSIPNNTTTQIIFDTTYYEHPTNGFLDPVTGTFTFSDPGHYKGIFSVQFAASAVGHRTLIVKKNSATVIAFQTDVPDPDGTTAKQMFLPFEDDFVIGDTLKFQVLQDSGGAANVGRTPNYSPEVVMSKDHHITPTPPPATGGTFTAITGAPALWYPDSVFHTPIASLGVGVHANSANIITSMLSRPTTNPARMNINEHFGTALGSGDYSHPVYFGDSGDPAFTIRQTGWANPDIEGLTIHCPAGAEGAGGTDFSMAVQYNGWEYSFQTVSSVGSGEIVCAFGRRCRIDGTGLSDGSSTRGGNTAMGAALGLGIVRADELVANTIDHALFLAVSGWHGRVFPGIGPTGTTGQIGDTNAPAMGQLLRLKTSYDPTAHGFPTWKVRVLTAMKTYGLYVGDNGGSCMGIHLESDVPYVSLGVTPTVQNYLDTTFSHSSGSTWDINTGVDWATVLEVMDPPSP